MLSSRSADTNKLIQNSARPAMEVKAIIKALNLFVIPQQIEMQAILPENEEEKRAANNPYADRCLEGKLSDRRVARPPSMPYHCPGQ